MTLNELVKLTALCFQLDQVYDPNLPEDDMRERYEEMARMREHVFGELDHDKDHFISIEEFLNYTGSQEFEKDEGWKVRSCIINKKYSLALGLTHFSLETPKG